MKTATVVALVTAGALALPGSAGAAGKGGGVRCQVTPDGTVFSSPGAMFRDARESFGFTRRSWRGRSGTAAPAR